MKKMHPTIPSLLLLPLLLSLLLLPLLACQRGDKAEPLSLGDVETATARPEPAPESRPLRVAISAIVSPRQTFVLYRDLLRYLEAKSGETIRLVQRETYEEVNELLRLGELDLAFVCSGAYVRGREAFGLEILVVPRAFGGTVYHSYIIVPAASPATSLADLRGRRFAFTDPMSNTGKLAPTYMLAGMDQTPESFFASFEFTYSHDKSIEAVARGLVDGAAVDSLIWEYLAATGSPHTRQTRIIQVSPPYGIPPVVVPPGLEPRRRGRLRDIFLAMHEDEEGKKILDRLLIERFEEIDDSSYDTIREMDSRVGKHVSQ